MKLDKQFIQSPTGQLVVIGVLAVLLAGVIGWQRTQRPASRMPDPAATAQAPLPKVIQRTGARFEPPVPPSPTPSAAPATTPARFTPKVLPLSVVAASRDSASLAPLAMAPFGRMIPCETVVTLESNRLATPVIGIVTEDVWEDGRLVVPAGAEVHGRAALDRARERLAVEGTWTIICRKQREMSARELRVTGIALERSLANADTDGSAGLRGEVIRTDDWRELKLFTATFLSSATTALQDTRTTAGLIGESNLPVASMRNASLAGVSAVLREYAQQVREAIAKDGFYLRIRAGKPFYLYVTETINGGPSTVALNKEIHSKP